MEDKGKSKVLIFGATGNLGKYMVKASISLGHPTYAFTRPNSSTSKLHILNDFKSLGVNIVHGELGEKEKIGDLIKQVDIVISTLAYPQIFDQLNIIDAIKTSGNIKRFIASDFGIEEDKVKPLPLFEEYLEKKRKVRRAIKEAGIPYTRIAANTTAAYYLNYLLNPHDQLNRDITVYGNEHAKVVMNYEEDVAMYTIKAADDPTTLNQLVIIRPPKNIISQLELINLWEKKTGRSFNKIHIPHKKLLELSQSEPFPQNIKMAILECLFPEGETVNYDKVKENGEIEASKLYPDYKYTTIDQLLDMFIVSPLPPASAAF